MQGAGLADRINDTRRDAPTESRPSMIPVKRGWDMGRARAIDDCDEQVYWPPMQSRRLREDGPVISRQHTNKLVINALSGDAMNCYSLQMSNSRS